MGSWTEPNDSPIWNFLKNHHPNLTPEVRQSVFRLLQENGIPPSDKIFPWVVDTMISRVQMGLLRNEIKELQAQLQALPGTLKSELSQGIQEPMHSLYLARLASESLTTELRASAVLDATLSQSGWRGIGAAFGAIFRLENLRGVVVFIGLISVTFGVGLERWLSQRELQIIQFNRGIIQDCERSYGADKDGNGWFTCPLFQLPAPKP